MPLLTKVKLAAVQILPPVAGKYPGMPATTDAMTRWIPVGT
jgi:hypothetical protein